MTYTYTDIFANYAAIPMLLLLPLAAVAGLAAVRVMLARGRDIAAWACSAAFIACVTLFGVVGMFPRLVPSSLDPAFSVTIRQAASSPLTLKIMLGVALLAVPVVIAYQTWVYFTFSHKVTEDELASGKAYY